jgi:acetate kinase
MIHHDLPSRTTISAQAETTCFELEDASLTSAMERGLDALSTGPTAVISELEQVHLVGHRIVHGGRLADRHALVDEQVISAVQETSHLAPLHNPRDLARIQCLRQLLPNARHVACFDTVFHSTLSVAARAYGGPL